MRCSTLVGIAGHHDIDALDPVSPTARGNVELSLADKNDRINDSKNHSAQQLSEKHLKLKLNICGLLANMSIAAAFTRRYPCTSRSKNLNDD
jgi:hypothetical protein